MLQRTMHVMTADSSARRAPNRKGHSIVLPALKVLDAVARYLSNHVSNTASLCPPHDNCWLDRRFALARA